MMLCCEGVLACSRDDFIEAATSALLEVLAVSLRFEDSAFLESAWEVVNEAGWVEGGAEAGAEGGPMTEEVLMLRKSRPGPSSEAFLLPVAVEDTSVVLALLLELPVAASGSSGGSTSMGESEMPVETLEDVLIKGSVEDSVTSG